MWLISSLCFTAVAQFSSPVLWMCNLTLAGRGGMSVWLLYKNSYYFLAQHCFLISRCRTSNEKQNTEYGFVDRVLSLFIFLSFISICFQIHGDRALVGLQLFKPKLPAPSQEMPGFGSTTALRQALPVLLPSHEQSLRKCLEFTTSGSFCSHFSQESVLACDLERLCSLLHASVAVLLEHASASELEPAPEGS